MPGQRKAGEGPEELLAGAGAHRRGRVSIFLLLAGVFKKPLAICWQAAAREWGVLLPGVLGKSSRFEVERKVSVTPCLNVCFLGCWKRRSLLQHVDLPSADPPPATFVSFKAQSSTSVCRIAQLQELN